LFAQLLQKAHSLHCYSLVKSQCFESSPRLNSFITFISDIARTVKKNTARTIEKTMLYVCRVYSLLGKNNGN
jgi:hypothetical protein